MFIEFTVNIHIYKIVDWPYYPRNAIGVDKKKLKFRVYLWWSIHQILTIPVAAMSIARVWAYGYSEQVKNHSLLPQSSKAI